MTVRDALLELGALALLLVACERETPAAPAPGERAPALNRVVSLSPLATRFVLAIGARSRLVAADAVSAQRPELAGLPAVDLRSAADLSPDLVLVPENPEPGDPAALALHRRGARIAEFAPHDFEDALAL